MRASPFERVRTLDPEPYQPILDQARTHLTAAFPAFRDMKVAESWGGVIDVTPDAVPVISAVDTLPGFFIATGFTGHGFGIGPGAGTADGGTGHRRDAGGRSDAVPLQPLHRRIAAAAVAAGLTTLS